MIPPCRWIFGKKGLETFETSSFFKGLIVYKFTPGMELGPGQIGKWMILLGLSLVGFGLLFVILGKIGLFRLPGDLEFGGNNWRLFLPITSCILLSIFLTLLFWLIGYFRR